jgi:hypothetical protein
MCSLLDIITRGNGTLSFGYKANLNIRRHLRLLMERRRSLVGIEGVGSLSRV